MNVPLVSASNLYQYLTVLGFTVACLCIYGIGQIQSNSIESYLGLADRFHAAEDDQQKEVWKKVIEQENSNSTYALFFLLGWATAGGTLFLVGAGTWYWKYQRHEDRKLVIEREWAEEKLRETKGQQKLFQN